MVFGVWERLLASCEEPLFYGVKRILRSAGGGKNLYSSAEPVVNRHGSLIGKVVLSRV